MGADKYLSLDDTLKEEKEIQAPTVSPGPQAVGFLAAVDPVTGQFDISFIPGSEVCVVEASENLAAWDMISFFDDAGTIKVRKADASAHITRCMGFVAKSWTMGQQATVFGEGIVSGQSGLDPANPVFLSTTAGLTSQTPANGAGDIWQEVGEAFSPTQFKFERQTPRRRA